MNEIKGEGEVSRFDPAPLSPSVQHSQRHDKGCSELICEYLREKVRQK